MKELLARLERCKGLIKGWDSYKADPPNDLSMENARKFLEICDKEEFLPSRLAPTCMGGIAMTWRGDNEKVFMEFYNNGTVYYIASHDEEDVDNAVVKEVKDYELGVQEIKAYFQ